VLRARLATAAVAIPLLLALVFLAPGWVWGAVVVLISLVALAEYLGLALRDQRGARIVGWIGGVAMLAGAMSAPRPGIWLAAAAAALLPLVLSYVVLTRNDLDRGLTDAGLVVIGVLYIGLLLPHFYWLREIPDGSRWVTFVIAITMAGDTGGYFVGHAFGRHKLIPRVSPGKTVEGAIGIVAASLLGAAIAKMILFPGHAWGEVLTLAGVMAVLGQLGDLGESVMKRSFGAKESGAIFPGHGGVLDRIDSLLFPVALVYYYLIATGSAASIVPC